MKFLLPFFTLITVAFTALPRPDLYNSRSAHSKRTLSHDELYQLHEKFWDTFVYPNNIAELLKVNSTLFAEDVVGRVDITRTYVGRELNTEYIFGSFAGEGYNPELQFVAGSPINHTTTRFATVGNLIAASEFVWLNTSLGPKPVEIDLWLLYNDNGELEQYDATFLRAALFFDAFISQFNALTGSTGTTGIAQIAAQQTCQVAMSNCNGTAGTDQEYSSQDDCMDFMLNSIRVGQSYELGMNTLFCRFLHAKILPLRPSVHCPHVGKTGGDMCIDDRTYGQIALESTFYYNDGPRVG